MIFQYFSVLEQFLHIVCTIEGFSYMGQSVILVWPIRSLDNVTLFFFFFFLKLCFHSPSEGLISNNLLFSLLFQHCCLCCSMYLFIFILKSVCGILNFFSVVRFMVDLTTLSAWSFPLMPVWLGTQHICISLSFDKFFNLQSILIINGWSNFLFFSDSNTDSKSEKMMNLLFLDSESYWLYKLLHWI